MITKELIVTNPKGIHVRPSGMLFQAASQFDAEIILTKDGQHADCSEMVSIIALGAQEGEHLTLTVQGPDEAAAAKEIERIFSLNFMDTD